MEEFQTERISIKKGSTNNPPYREFFVDYPSEGRRAIVSEIRRWINNVCSEYIGIDYNQSLENGERMIQFYSDNADEDLEVVEVNFRKDYETSQYVTFQYTIYRYASGNVHGESNDGGATFRLTDGQIIDWGMFNNDSNMQDMIKSGFKEYFGNDDYEKEFNPLPKCNPIFLRNGVKFLYDTYEIEGTGYAQGQPQFTIPYSEIKNNMKSALKEIVE